MLSKSVARWLAPALLSGCLLISVPAWSDDLGASGTANPAAVYAWDTGTASFDVSLTNGDAHNEQPAADVASQSYTVSVSNGTLIQVNAPSGFTVSYSGGNSATVTQNKGNSGTDISIGVVVQCYDASSVSLSGTVQLTNGKTLTTSANAVFSIISYCLD